MSWCVGHLMELAQPEAYGEQYACRAIFYKRQRSKVGSMMRVCCDLLHALFSLQTGL